MKLKVEQAKGNNRFPRYVLVAENRTFFDGNGWTPDERKALKYASLPVIKKDWKKLQKEMESGLIELTGTYIVGVGVNGEYVIFYERQATSMKPEGAKSKADHFSLIEGLRSLGIATVTHEQIEAALDVCFPKGTTGQDESNVLRVVFRHLKRSGGA
jgi:hypothetical protein